MYVDPRVTQLIDRSFLPVRVHVKEQAAEYKRLSARYNALWTPTTLILDGGGDERHRIEGFLPAEEFQAQLALGLGHVWFGLSDFTAAERQFRKVADEFTETDAGPEALYWAGVACYKASGDPQALADTYGAFQERFQDTTWAKKASVWGPG